MPHQRFDVRDERGGRCVGFDQEALHLMPTLGARRMQAKVGKPLQIAQSSRQRGAGVHAHLGVDARQLRLDCLGRHEQGGRDLLVRFGPPRQAWRLGAPSGSGPRPRAPGRRCARVRPARGPPIARRRARRTPPRPAGSVERARARRLSRRCAVPSASLRPRALKRRPCAAEWRSQRVPRGTRSAAALSPQAAV